MSSKKIIRHLEKVVLMSLKQRRVVLLAGPRQCGKTTLAKSLVSNKVIYRTLDDLNFFTSASQDPQSFVKHQGKTLIIDEVQRAPILLTAIKKEVDEQNRAGQFLITGSANIFANPSTQESLAGRMKRLRLRTLSQSEKFGTEPHFLQSCFLESFPVLKEHYSREDIFSYAMQGGYPEAFALDEKQRQEWHLDYTYILLEKDLKDIANIKKHSAMKDLIKVLATYSGKFIDLSAIQATLSLQKTTLENYIHALEALYLVERLPAWTISDYDRVTKRPKLFLTDSGLMASLLSWSLNKLLFHPEGLGKLAETLVFNELATHIDFSNSNYQLYHYRDREKREIDFIVEREDGALLGIEVKASNTIKSDDFKHLRWFQQKHKSFIGLVLYTGSQSLSFGPHL